ncbi:beta-Ig-H3/fasciclin [Streptomyces fructofermentans]|uniref:beta-Ig-H3/fasciclin n=1 Tax=Streptomyces fructofermentans TaxID=152141 RepID=UPI0033F4B555
MRIRTTLVRAAAVTAAVAGGLALSAPTASAAVGDTAPACVKRTVYETPAGFDVFLQNTCGGTMSVKVIVDNGGDSNCYVMSAGTNKNFVYEGIFGSYGKTVLC